MGTFAYRQQAVRQGTVSMLAAVVFLAASGCASVDPNFAPSCLPPPFSLSSSTVQAGEEVTVRASDADCDPRYGAGAQIEVHLINPGHDVVASGIGPMGDAGAFEHVLTVPLDVTPGKYVIAAMPYRLDWCDDTGRNNRVPLEGAALERASCVRPEEPLTVTEAP
ncbi:hypothetical protein BJ994_003337 [Arthrobacter pigmenti]|uniref:Lipoprotein n=1 Tax=Arthrobacter pigmenti TaxID=271432 RepID=A0A846S1F0_9MICC|nr:hypothetical protein [Arthrobacter pigmenti]NJC24261.1 hypothetical protein [Arthrobacter pigmenti]